MKNIINQFDFEQELQFLDNEPKNLDWNEAVNLNPMFLRLLTIQELTNFFFISWMSINNF